MSLAEWLKNGYIAVSRAFGALRVVMPRGGAGEGCDFDENYRTCWSVLT